MTFRVFKVLLAGSKVLLAGSNIFLASAVCFVSYLSAVLFGSMRSWR
jgi:hypothetical protein